MARHASPSSEAKAYLARIPPVVEVAVYAHECETEHEYSPQCGADPVDSEQRDEEWRPYRPKADNGQKHHQREESRHDPLHVFPLCEKRGVDRRNAAELDYAVDHNIDVAEKYGHVACRSQPQIGRAHV